MLLKLLNSKHLIFFVLFVFSFAHAQHFQMTYTIEVSGQYAKNVKNMIPNTLHLFISPTNTLSYLSGGLANPMKMISNIETGEAFLLRFTEKKYSKIPRSGKNDSLVWKKMPEVKVISNFTCQRYQLVLEQEALGASKQDVWITNDLKINTGLARTQLKFPTKNGFPVKMSLDMGMYVLTYTLSDVKKNINEPSIFEIPSGFSEEIFNPNKIGRDVLN